MARVVVLGAGIGGISAAYELRRLIGRKAGITVVSDSEWFQFVPSNPWVALKWREPEDIKIHLPPVLAKLGIAFEAVGARRVLPQENRIALNDGRMIDYDFLVIATGPALAFDEVQGLGPAANTISICHVDDAAAAAKRWEEFCKNPGAMVIGAVQGASCFGPAYEFALLANADLRRRKIRDRVPMTFVTAEPYIGHLGLGGVGDTKGLLESMLRDRDVKWITNAKIDRVGPDQVEVSELGDDGTLKRQHRIASTLTMFIPAFRGVAFIALPQIPPRNINWAGQGYWVHLAKVAFEKYLLRKVRNGKTEPSYERIVMKALGIAKLRPGGAAAPPAAAE